MVLLRIHLVFDKCSAMALHTVYSICALKISDLSGIFSNRQTEKGEADVAFFLSTPLHWSQVRFTDMNYIYTKIK